MKVYEKIIEKEKKIENSLKSIDNRYYIINNNNKRKSTTNNEIKKNKIDIIIINYSSKFNKISIYNKILYLFIILSFINPNSSLNASYNIILTINKTGYSKIFFNGNVDSFYPDVSLRPREVYINGYNKNVSDGYNFEQINNTVELRFNSIGIIIACLFYNCSNITKIDLSNFDTSSVEGMAHLFHGCSSLTSINFTNFKTDIVEYMDSMFQGCSSLTSLDLSMFKTSKAVHMHSLFYGCSLLSFLDISSFNTDSAKSLDYMFEGCQSLISLDLSNFNISLANDINGMFNGCKNLKYLNLTNVNITKFASIQQNFVDCSNLKYINFGENYDSWGEIAKSIVREELKVPIIIKYQNIYSVFENYLNFSINSFQIIDTELINNPSIQNISNKYYFSCFFYFFFEESKNRYICTGKKICPQTHNKLIFDIKECVKSCNETVIYKYEYNNICLKKCPKNFITNQTNCSPDCPIKTPFLLMDTLECVEFVDTNQEFFFDVNGIAKKILNNHYESDNLNKDISSKILDALNNNELEIILEQMMISNSSVLIEEEDSIHQITFLKNQKDKNISFIDFGVCEKILKNFYNINDEELLIYKIENKVEGFNIPIIEYGLFTQNGTKRLNLSICDNSTLEYYIPVAIDEEKLYKYDPSNNYYTDICNKYPSEENVDMTLYEKKNQYNNKNLSLCESKCIFKGYNSTTSLSICDCYIKNDITYSKDDDKNNLLNKIPSDKSSSNLDVTKCHNVFSFPDKIKTNSGFLTISIILGIFIIIFIIFCIKGKNALENKIDEVIYKKFKNDKNNNKDNKIIKKRTINKKNNISPPLKNKKFKISQKKSSSQLVNKKNSIKNIITSSNNYINKKSIKNILNKNLNENKPDINNDYELNSLSYENALKYDKRTCCEYYISLIKNKQIIAFTFCTFNDYNSGIIKKFVFFLSFALHYTINALFFNDSNMHQIYEDKGIYNFSYQLPKILISSISSIVILRIMLITLILTDKNILQVKNQPSKNLAIKMKQKILKYINIKFVIFFDLISFY